MHVYVYPPGHSRAASIRSTFSDSLSQYYSGWSDEFDQQFASRTVCFGLSAHPDHKPLAMCRVICRKYGATVGALPMETGDKSGCARKKGERVAEGSGFWWTELADGIDLLHGVMRWLLMHDVNQGYVIFDPRVERTRNLYTKTLGLKWLPNEKVIYTSFTRKQSCEPMEWHVATGNRRSFKNSLQLLKSAGAKQRQIRVPNMLGGWTPCSVLSDKGD